MDATGAIPLNKLTQEVLPTAPQATCYFYLKWDVGWQSRLDVYFIAVAEA
ncbi:MAG TPA: hypothetical protein V6C91_07260 [Coleofasciculaceae cyanobacterium]